MPKNPVTDPTTDREVAFAGTLHIGRDQILARLWYLANLNPEATRSSISGQVKAVAMIIAIEGLIPDRRLPLAQPASPPVKASIYESQWRRPQSQAETTEASAAVTAVEAQPSDPQVPVPPHPTPTPSPALNPVRNPENPDDAPLFPKGMNWVPEANGRVYDAHPAGPFSLPMLPWKNPRGRGR